MRALLLEDDQATQALYCECIRAAGHEVVPCTTILDALKALRTAKIDILILDLVIGNSNSLGLVQYAGYAAPNAEIIMVTGSGEFANGEILKDYPGLTWFLRKPLRLSDLEAFVSHAEQRYKSEGFARVC